MIARNAFIELLGRFLGSGISFISSIILMRYLSPEDFGLVAMGMIVVTIAEVVADVGFGSAIVQKLELSKEELNTSFFLNLMAGSVVSFIVFITANQIGYFYNNDDSVIIIRVFCLVIIAASFSTIPVALHTRKLNFSFLTKVNVISALSGSVIAIILAINGAEYWSLVSLYIIHYTVRALIFWIKPAWGLTFNVSFSAMSGIWNYSLSIFLVQVINIIYSRLDSILIAKYFNVKALGFYNRARAINDMVTQYSAASLAKVLFPVLSRSQENSSLFSSQLIKGLRMTSFISLMATSFLYSTAKELIVLLFGSEWLATADFLIIVVFAILPHNLNFLMGHGLKATGKSSLILKTEIAKKTLMTLSIITGTFYGIEGIILAVVCAKYLALTINVFILSWIGLVSSLESISIMVKDIIFFFIPAILLSQLSVYILGSSYLLAAAFTFLIYLVISYKLLNRRALVQILSSFTKSLRAN